MYQAIENIASFLWGAPLIGGLSFLGIYLSFKSGFFQFRRLGYIFSETFGKLKIKGKKGREGFRAMCMALGGTIGVGNIAGVATAITLGGPGAIFWMWISGFFGMIIKYAEIALSVRYRIIKDNGECVGGPMYYMHFCGIKILNITGYIFALFCVIASFFMGNIAQTDTVSRAFSNTFYLPRVAVCLFISILLIPVLLGRAQKIKALAEILVPLMSGLYIVFALIVIISNLEGIIPAIKLIIIGAFYPKTAAAGIGGYGIYRAISVGFSKGLFTNEAGMGSAPIAHASNPNATEKGQGMWGIAEVFIDTIVVCTITALAILSSDIYLDGSNLSGIELTLAVFTDTLGKTLGEGILTVSIGLFAFASIIAWNYYGKCALESLTHKKWTINIYMFAFIIISILGAFTETESIMFLSDMINAPLLLLNIPAILLLSHKCINKNELYKE